jgi:8-oxo-dGTP pyrophosphatase MutT (NUDIX family)
MPPNPPPFTFTVPSPLTPFSVPTSSYLLKSQAEYDAIASSVLVFAQNKAQDEEAILLVQRAAHDTMPNKWEVPGGAVDAGDASILHGAARELWEETGLLVTAFKKQVGEGIGRGFRTSRGLWVCGLTFEAEVDGTGNGVPDVRLDENEHQRFVWASEEECRAKRVRGEDGVLEIEFTSVTVQETVLEAFRMRKLEKEG